MTDKEMIDQLLNNTGFREMVTNDIGSVLKVNVNWDKNNIVFYGMNATKEIKIDETLAVLRGQIQ